MSKTAGTCWDFWNCKGQVKEKCTIFKLKAGDNCWNYQDSVHPNCPATKDAGVKGCISCPFYMKMNAAV